MNSASLPMLGMALVIPLAASPAVAESNGGCFSFQGVVTCVWNRGFLPIPAGVSRISFEVYGAQGGCDLGGKGGAAFASVSVAPGDVFTVEIGTQGEPPLATGGGRGGWPSGGPGGSSGWNREGATQHGCGGGGRSTVRRCGVRCDPIIVAGGGGGMSWPYDSIRVAGGAGGENGEPGGNGPQHIGGFAWGGAGGTASAGGAGGEPQWKDESDTCAFLSSPGDFGDTQPFPGSFVGYGGGGGWGCWGGGGGGGGYHGGGGGAAGGGLPGGGGGGGSSYVDPTLSDRSFVTGVREGAGLVVYRYVDPTPPTEHFQCYEPRAATFPPTAATVEDRFGMLQGDVRSPRRFCTAAGKNGEFITDPTEHLTGYPFRPRITKRPNLVMLDPFGTLQLDVVASAFLMVPTETNGRPLAFPPSDHFQCYKVKPSRGAPRFVRRTVTVASWLEVGTTTLELKKPSLLCTPTNTNGEDPTAPDHPDHLLCYTARSRSKFPGVDVTIDNQFGHASLQVARRRELCVPAKEGK